MTAPVALFVWLAAGSGAVKRVDTAQRVVALTFDGCATATNTFSFDQALFDIIKSQRLPATFFLSGRWIEAHRAAAQEIAALSFVEIGNHAWDHPPFSPLTDRQIESQLSRTDQTIASLGRKSAGFRPPFGDWGRKLLPVADRLGLPVILWDVVSGDAGGHLQPATMVKTVLRDVRPGSIVIFHVNGRGPFSKDALPGIVTGLRAKGYRFVTVPQLLALPDAKPVAAKPARYVRRADLAPAKVPQ